MLRAAVFSRMTMSHPEGTEWFSENENDVNHVQNYDLQSLHQLNTCGRFWTAVLDSRSTIIKTPNKWISFERMVLLPSSFSFLFSVSFLCESLDVVIQLISPGPLCSCSWLHQLNFSSSARQPAEFKAQFFSHLSPFSHSVCIRATDFNALLWFLFCFLLFLTFSEPILSRAPGPHAIHYLTTFIITLTETLSLSSASGSWHFCYTMKPRQAFSPQFEQYRQYNYSLLNTFWNHEKL